MTSHHWPITVEYEEILLDFWYLSQNRGNKGIQVIRSRKGWIQRKMKRIHKHAICCKRETTWPTLWVLLMPALCPFWKKDGCMQLFVFLKNVPLRICILLGVMSLRWLNDCIMLKCHFLWMDVALLLHLSDTLAIETNARISLLFGLIWRCMIMQDHWKMTVRYQYMLGCYWGNQL